MWGLNIVKNKNFGIMQDLQHYSDTYVCLRQRINDYRVYLLHGKEHFLPNVSFTIPVEFLTLTFSNYNFPRLSGRRPGRLFVNRLSYFVKLSHERDELNDLATKMGINLDFPDWECRSSLGTFFKDPRKKSQSPYVALVDQ